jgi:hypothetical protein
MAGAVLMYMLPFCLLPFVCSAAGHLLAQFYPQSK